MLAPTLETLSRHGAASVVLAGRPHARVVLALDDSLPLHHHGVVVGVERDRTPTQLQVAKTAHKAGRGAGRSGHGRPAVLVSRPA